MACRLLREGERPVKLVGHAVAGRYRDLVSRSRLSKAEPAMELC
jgi:hypothetical protein